MTDYEIRHLMDTRAYNLARSPGETRSSFYIYTLTPEQRAAYDRTFK